jgi:hypothetical protein
MVRTRRESDQWNLREVSADRVAVAPRLQIGNNYERL